MAITPNFSYTYTGNILEEIMDNPQFVRSIPLSSVATPINTKYKEQFTLTNPMTKITRAKNDCGRNWVGSGTIGNVELEVKPLAVEVEQCPRVFEQTWLVQYLRTGAFRNDINGTALSEAIARVLLRAASTDLTRIYWFGDTDSASPDYSPIDGALKKIIAGNGTTTQIVNNAVNALNQTAGTRTLDYLRQIHESCSAELRLRTDAVFLVTPNHYFNLASTYENAGLVGGDLAYTELQDGRKVLSFRGYPVIKMEEWGIDLADVANPFNPAVAGGLGNPLIDNLIIFTTPEAHLLGSDQAGEDVSIDVWYDRDEDKMRYAGGYTLGYATLYRRLTALSYGNI